MRIIIKYIVKNMFEKKFYTFLIVFSVMLSSMLFFLTRSLLDVMILEAVNNLKCFSGNSDIIVQSESGTATLFNINKANELKSDFEYVIGALQGIAVFKDDNRESSRISLQGIDLEDQQLMNPIKLEKEYKLQPFTGKKIIISSKMAEKYNLEVGNSINLKINNTTYKFVISGISKPEGFFMQSGETTNVIIPKEVLGSIYDAGKKSSIAFIKVKNLADKKNLIKKLSDIYPDNIVKESISQSEINQYLKGMKTAFWFIVVMLFCISFFIIYSSFKVISIERLQVIGTFRSIGATKKTSNFILLAESLFYGLTGGILGCVLGVVLLFVIVNIMIAEYDGTFAFIPAHLCSSFIVAIILPLISTFLPILSVSRTPLKDIILNTMDKKTVNKVWKLVTGVLMLIFVLVMPRIVPYNLALIVDTLCILFIVADIILLNSYVSLIVSWCLEPLYTLVFGNIGKLAVKNIKENKHILTNISLLAIGIAGLLTIKTVGSDILQGTVDHYKTRFFDIVISSQNTDKNFVQVVRGTEGVKDVYCIYEAHNLRVHEKQYYLSAVQGADKNKFLNYWDMDIIGDRQALINKLDEGRYILVASTLKNNLGLKVGDDITFEMKTGNRSYEVIGFYNTLIFNGNCALIAERYLKSDMRMNDYYRMYVKTNQDPAIVHENIKNNLVNKQIDSYLNKDAQREALEGNKRLFNILDVFSILTLIIGILGVFNNLLISFLERRRSFAVLRSIGMSKIQIVQMIFLEALSGGGIGGLIGVLSGIIMISEMPYVMKAINQPIEITIKYNYIFIYLVVGILVTLIASISPALKSSKLNIIESIKYE